MSILARAQITIVVINDGPTGPTGKRMLTGMVHYQLSNASAPAKPSATSFNFATRVFSGLTSNWAIDSPVYASGNANKYWYCTYTVEESASGSGTGTPIFGTVKQAIGFSGLVTFTGDQSVSDGTKTLSFGAAGTTKIDGGNIETGTVSADRIDVDNLVVKQAVIGKIQDVAGPIASTAKDDAIAAAASDATTKANAAKAAAEATAAALDAAIQVGGRNLLLNSTYANRIPLYLMTATVTNIEDLTLPSKQKMVYSNVVKDSNSYCFYLPTNNSKSYFSVSMFGKPFVWSFYMKANVPQTLVYSSGESTITTEWKRIEIPFHINYGNVHTQLFGEGLTTFEVSSIKVELGNKATDWTPAPEDVDADATAKADAAQAAAEATASGLTNTAKNALAAAAGYTDYDDMVAKADLTVNGMLNSQIINVDDLFVNTAFISKLLSEDGFIENLTVKFLETVGDANGYKVQIQNSLNSDAAGAESYVRLVNSDGTRKAELVFDTNNVYGASGGLPVLRITDNGCYSRVFAEGLEAVSTVSGRYSYNMLSQFTPFGMVFATGTHASAAVKGGFTWNENAGKVSIYVNTLPRGGQGTVSTGFLYRAPDGLNNDAIRYQS